MTVPEIRQIIRRHHEKLMVASLAWLQVLLLLMAVFLPHKQAPTANPLPEAPPAPNPETRPAPSASQARIARVKFLQPPQPSLAASSLLQYISTSPFQYLPYRTRADGATVAAQPGANPGGEPVGMQANLQTPGQQRPGQAQQPDAQEARKVVARNCVYLAEVLQGTEKEPQWIEAWGGKEDMVYSVRKTDRRVISIRKKDGQGDRPPTGIMYLTEDGTLYTKE